MELYHLWFEKGGEIILRSDIEETNDTENIPENELRANRFAAEFLTNEELLLQEIRNYNMDKNKLDIKDILRLSNLFIVRIKQMVRRLYEIKLINKERYNQFMKLTNEQIEIWRNRLGLSIPIRDKKISLSDLIDRAMELYERKDNTRKVKHLLNFAELTWKEWELGKRNHIHLQRMRS